METTYRYIEDEHVTLDDGTDYTKAVLRRCVVTYNGGPVRIDGATIIGSNFKFAEAGAHAQSVMHAYFRSLYADGHRTLNLREDGKLDMD